MTQRKDMIKTHRALMSEQGSSLLATILIAGVVGAIMMVSSQNFNRGRDLNQTQTNKANADDRVAEVRGILSSAANCKQALGGRIHFSDKGVPSLISANGVFGAVDATFFPNGSGTSRPGVIGTSEIELSAPIFPGVKLYVATLHAVSIFPNTQTAAHSYSIPIYLAVNANNEVQFCQHTKVIMPDQITVEDQICKLSFASTIPDIVYNPLAGLCQSRNATVIAGF